MLETGLQQEKEQLDKKNLRQQGAEKITAVFKNKKALMPYLTAGDPDLATSKKIILTLEKLGVDLIEVGIPFSDPLADGPVIQSAGQRALQAGTNLKKILEMLQEIKNQLQTPILLMGYLNPILSYGKDRFIEDATAAGAAGVIIPDLPFDQDEEFLQKLISNNLAPVLMVTPVTTEKRLAMITKQSKGFLYCVSLLGTTGSQQGPMLQIDSYLQQVRKYTDLPLALGFGIDGPEKVKKIIEKVDGIIIGSALVKIIAENGQNHEQLIKKISDFIIEIKEVM